MLRPGEAAEEGQGQGQVESLEASLEARDDPKGDSFSM